MSDKAPNDLAWGPPGEVPDTEWAWVRLRWGTKPLIGRRTATIEHPQFYCFAPVLDIAALQDQLATAERRAEEAEAQLVSLREMRLTPRQMDVHMDGEAVTALVHNIAECMLAAGVGNYLETRIDTSGPSGRFVLTIQRAHGLTPHEAREKAEAERDDFARVLAIVGTALAAGEAEPMVDAAMRVAGERDALRARVTDLETLGAQAVEALNTFIEENDVERSAPLPHESWTMAARRRLAQALEKKP